MNGAQPLNKGKMLHDQVQMAPVWRKPGFSMPDAPAIVCFKLRSRVGKQCFSSTTAKGVHALVVARPNCNSFTKTTSMQYLES